MYPRVRKICFIIIPRWFIRIPQGPELIINYNPQCLIPPGSMPIPLRVLLACPEVACNAHQEKERRVTRITRREREKAWKSVRAIDTDRHT